MKSLEFDKVIMNPPYSGSLHLKILLTVIKNCPKAEIVNLSPIRWLQDPLAEYKKSSDWKKFQMIRDRITDLEVVTAHNASDIFFANIKMDLGVYHITPKGGWTSNYNDSIVDKVISSNHIGIPITKVGKSSKKSFALISTIVGDHSGFDNVFANSSVISNENTYGKYYVDGKSEMNGLTVAENKASNKRSVHGTAENFACVEFDTENEVKNFYDFVYTKLFLYVLRKSTVDVHVHPQFLPWLGDYTHPWTDKDLYEYFNLTEEEIREIECSIK